MDSGLLPGRHVLAGISRAGCNNLHAFLYNHLRHLVGKGAHQHDVHTERFIRQLLCAADLTSEPIGVCVHRRDDTESASVADSRREVRVGNPGHTALENRILNSEQFADRRLQHVTPPPLLQ